MRDLNMEHSQLTDLDSVVHFCDTLDVSKEQFDYFYSTAVLSFSTIDNTKQTEVPWLTYVDFFLSCQNKKQLSLRRKQASKKNRTDLFLHFIPLITLIKPK